TLDWRPFPARVGRRAAGLQSLGVGRGDRVAVLAQSSGRYIECYFGPLWLGAAVVPVNSRFSLEEVAFLLKDSGARVLEVDDAFREMAQALRGQCPALEHIVYADDGPLPTGMVSYEALLAAKESVPEVVEGAAHMAGLFYTGGTTGRPKGVMLSHTNIHANALNTIAHMHFDEETVHLLAGPLFHVATGARVYGMAIAAGCVVVLPRFDSREVIAAIERHRVTAANFVPTMSRMLLDEPALGQADLSSLRVLTTGAAPTTDVLKQELMRRFPRADLVELYGMTELSPGATFIRHSLTGPKAAKVMSGGRAVFTAEVRIVDPEDRELPRGDVGEIVVRGPMVMMGYWNLPELSAETLRGGWMHTGDTGYMDEDGYVFLVDRIKDMIISGGENVYSVEVENVISQYPGIHQCAVIGVPDDLWGERVHAIVVPAAGQALDPDALIAHCRQKIAAYKCPRTVEIRQEGLPLSPVGKVLKNELRAQARRQN
ncbi:MAG: long-chain-fatty-acid--CoA ligase, partial [Ectothiorhodospiraceae bacterium]|nr:long-chain-fatty-acid--CoA ligase [Ectothiorhodospiraceae bacterium]